MENNANKLEATMVKMDGSQNLQILFIAKKEGRLEIDIRNNSAGIFDKFGEVKTNGQINNGIHAVKSTNTFDFQNQLDRDSYSDNDEEIV